MRATVDVWPPVEAGHAFRRAQARAKYNAARAALRSSRRLAVARLWFDHIAQGLPPYGFVTNTSAALGCARCTVSRDLAALRREVQSRSIASVVPVAVNPGRAGGRDS